MVLEKSSTIQHLALDPLEHLELSYSVISKTTSSRFVKLLGNQHKGRILSPEVFGILNKLMKSDEDNATGDVQLLCKLFSSERCSIITKQKTGELYQPTHYSASWIPPNY